MIEIILGIAILIMVLTALGVWMMLTIPMIHWWARKMGINPTAVLTKLKDGKETVTKWVSSHI